jgi:hypothetical protein
MDQLRARFIERRVEDEVATCQFRFVLAAGVDVRLPFHSMESDRAFASPDVQAFRSQMYRFMDASQSLTIIRKNGQPLPSSSSLSEVIRKG